MDNDHIGRTSIDDFWDLASLVPSRPAKKQAKAFSEPMAPPVVADMKEEEKPARPAEERRITGLSPSDAAAREYQPAWNCLIVSVRVRARGDGYSFYGRFRRDAERYLDAVGKPCPYVKYFSYIPQYVQLSREQLCYYLYWRDCVRRGEYPKTDESYFYLYVYEIINLPDKIPPECRFSAH